MWVKGAMGGPQVNKFEHVWGGRFAARRWGGGGVPLPVTVTNDIMGSDHMGTLSP